MVPRWRVTDETSLLVDQLRLMATHHPDEIAFRVLDADTLTFAQWEGASNQFGRALQAAGVNQGDRVAIYVAADDALRWVIAYAAVHKAGAVAVPLNTRLTRLELEALLAHAEAKAIVCSPSLAPVAHALAAAVPSLAMTISTDDLLSGDDSTFQVPVSAGDLADIMYTSGTTGRPKGVVVRHRNSALIPNNVPAWSGSYWMHGSPLFTFAGISFIYNPMKMGMRCLYQPRFDPGRWLRAVAEERPLAVFIVPAMAQLLIAHPDFAGADLSSIVMCSLGSAPLAPATLAPPAGEAARRHRLQRLRHDRGGARLLLDAQGGVVEAHRIGRAADAADGGAGRRRGGRDAAARPGGRDPHPDARP